MRLMPKIILIAVSIPVITYACLLSLHDRAQRNYFGKAYSDTVNYLDGEVQKLQAYVSEMEKYAQANREEFIRFSSILSGELVEIEMEFESIPSKIPMKKNYYAYLFRALRGDVGILAAVIEGRSNLTWIDKEYVRKRIIRTCEKIRWSLNVIRENANKYHGTYGYFQELYFQGSSTHETIDDELDAFLKKVHKIHVH
jgi:hypothetical protein